jgi:hypothetical protein
MTCQRMAVGTLLVVGNGFRGTDIAIWDWRERTTRSGRTRFCAFSLNGW